MDVAIIGIGKMGRAIAERLASEGHNLTLWNRTAARAKGVENTEGSHDARSGNRSCDGNPVRPCQ